MERHNFAGFGTRIFVPVSITNSFLQETQRSSSSFSFPESRQGFFLALEIIFVRIFVTWWDYWWNIVLVLTTSGMYQFSQIGWKKGQKKHFSLQTSVLLQITSQLSNARKISTERAGQQPRYLREYRIMNICHQLHWSLASMRLSPWSERSE